MWLNRYTAARCSRRPTGRPAPGTRSFGRWRRRGPATPCRPGLKPLVYGAAGPRRRSLRGSAAEALPLRRAGRLGAPTSRACCACRGVFAQRAAAEIMLFEGGRSASRGSRALDAAAGGGRGGRRPIEEAHQPGCWRGGRSRPRAVATRATAERREGRRDLRDLRRHAAARRRRPRARQAGASEWHRRTKRGKADGSGHECLTERWLEVARLVVDRKTNAQIAEERRPPQDRRDSHPAPVPEARASRRAWRWRAWWKWANCEHRRLGGLRRDQGARSGSVPMSRVVDRRDARRVN